MADLDAYLQFIGITLIRRRIVPVRFTLEASNSVLPGPRLDVLRARQTPMPVETAASQAPVLDVAPTPKPHSSIMPAPVSPARGRTVPLLCPGGAA